MAPTNQPTRYLLIGKLEVGKTSLCLHLVEILGETGWDVAGAISPAVFKAESKVAIDLLDPRSGQRRRLATLLTPEVQQTGPATKRWGFDADALAWGDQLLAQAAPCDLLIVDELGPLELERGEGWLSGLAAIDNGDYKAAVIVVRPHLLHLATQRWPDAEVVLVSDEVDARTQAAALARQILKSSRSAPKAS
jgi:nucleoside-triphosphatase THEP1